MVVDEVDRDAEGYCCWIYESSMLRVVAAVDNTKGLPMDNSCTLNFFFYSSTSAIVLFLPIHKSSFLMHGENKECSRPKEKKLVSSGDNGWTDTTEGHNNSVLGRLPDLQGRPSLLGALNS